MVRSLHLYEVKLLDGSRYRGEITYRDDKRLVLLVNDQFSREKLSIFYNGILSIRELGWQRVHEHGAGDNF